MPSDDAPSDVLAIAARFRREARALRAEADKRERAADVLEAKAAETVDEVEAARAGLTGMGSERTIRTMDVNPANATPAVKRAIGRATRKHPAQTRLYEKGVTISALAKELGENRARVSAWFADGEANRAVPERHVETMRKKYGIPRSAWTRIHS